MDINDLFDGIAEAFRQYQAEMVEQEQASSNSNPTGLGPKAEAEKTEKKAATGSVCLKIDGGGGGSRTRVLNRQVIGVYMLSIRLKSHFTAWAGHLPTVKPASCSGLVAPSGSPALRHSLMSSPLTLYQASRQGRHCLSSEGEFFVRNY